MANKYGDEWREVLIRVAIHRAVPFPIFGWFNVCPLNDVRDVLGVSYPGNDAYVFLNSLHCVDWRHIPKKIRKRLPALIREALTPDKDVKEIAELERMYRNDGQPQGEKT